MSNTGAIHGYLSGEIVGIPDKNQEKPKGKNFSKANRGQRRAGDFYQTPRFMVEALLDRMKINCFPVAEPASGLGSIVRSLDERFGRENVAFYDLSHGIDFLQEWNKYPYIITNPPFTLSTEFIRKSREVATKGFALLMPIEYLHGKERYEEFYKDAKGYPLTRVLIFTRRAMLTDKVREDGKYDTGMITWCWYIWERKPLHRGPSRPVIEWIDNDADVLRKEKREITPKH